jgi:hypothetical protein
VFDDERTGIKEEAFVLGMCEMISKVVEANAIPNASMGFELMFDAVPFGHDVELNWLSPSEAATALNYWPSEIPKLGNWYKGHVLGHEMIGWLCPALFLYFKQAPTTIYANAEPYLPMLIHSGRWRQMTRGRGDLFRLRMSFATRSWQRSCRCPTHDSRRAVGVTTYPLALATTMPPPMHCAAAALYKSPPGAVRLASRIKTRPVKQKLLFESAKPELTGTPPAPAGREWPKSFVSSAVWRLIKSPPAIVLYTKTGATSQLDRPRQLGRQVVNNQHENSAAAASSFIDATARRGAMLRHRKERLHGLAETAAHVMP